MELIPAEKLEELSHYLIMDIDIYNKNKAEEIANVAANMSKLCVEKSGVGLSACQIGINERFFVFRFEKNSFGIVVNPSWWAKSSRYKIIEGCLSYPGESYIVKRYKKIQAEYWTIDEKKDFKYVKREFIGEVAQIFQHESDHCRGVTIATKGRKYNK